MRGREREGRQARGRRDRGVSVRFKKGAREGRREDCNNGRDRRKKGLIYTRGRKARGT